ncbi:uncharacterized protein LOC120340710 isoform X2 [Styela clava]|uniref:uncharacterized protein LOC120340710 isoform X2 n=1 Tax=Styela clava TaxID=7725 RepID=UPI00193A982A|nr:uncharacterized protein LOC120340710 isoform X2 [Styela clava]
MLQHRDNRFMEAENGLQESSKNFNRERSIPIPVKGSGKARPHRNPSSGFFDSSDDSISDSNNESPPIGDGFPVLSSSYHGGFNNTGSSSNLPLNVYGTSPRTLVMFNYYSSPRGSYNRPHHPNLIRTRSTDAPNHHSTAPPPHSQSENVNFRHSAEFSNGEKEKNRKSETTTLLPQSNNKGKPSGLSRFQQLDLRPRAWSESDKHANNTSLQNSRMSALRKLKMKLGQKGSLKRQKSHEDDDRNTSAASITSLEKVEEGRQLNCATPKISQGVCSPEILSNNNAASLHQEHETRRRAERRVGVVKYSSPSHSLPQVNENPEDYLIYQRFLEEHTCYDLMPTSSKLVVLDTRLEVKKAFHALIENSLRCAPLWDNDLHDYVGLLTVSDFVSILLAYDKCPNKKLEDLENQKISCWRKVLNSKQTLIHVPPQSSLFHSLKRLTEENIRRLAIVHPDNGDVFHVINHRRILHFLHLFMNELPKPKYMSKTVEELSLGTRKDVATIDENSPVIDALKLLDQHKISALPVVDAKGRVTDMFTKTDVLVLAGEQLFYDLSIKVKTVISFHAAVEPDESEPTVVRTMPGSPALVRRRNQPRQNHPHNSSTPVNSNHPFLYNSNNTPRMMPSPLVGSSLQTNRTSSGHSENRKSREIKHHQQPIIKTPGQNAKEQSFGKGEPVVLSPPNTQVFLHRRRHLSSNLSKSTSISSHLVTVSRDDTLEFVVNNVVTSDVLQAVIVDDSDHVIGVISVGDILRFMVYPTKDGQIDNKYRGRSISSDGTSSSTSSNQNLLEVTTQRARAISDDSDLASANLRKDTHSSDSGYSDLSTLSITEPSYANANGRAITTDNTTNNDKPKNITSTTEKVRHASGGNTQPTTVKKLSAGEQIERL